MASDDDKNEDEETGTEAKKPAVVDASFEEEGEGLEPKAEASLAKAGEEGEESASEGDEEDDESVLPTVMGYRRYIYAAFFSFAIALAYFLSKAGLAGWHRLSQWTPKVGEPREDLMTPIAAVVSAITIFMVYRRPDVRQLADEVALELSKVEWPTREKVRRSTTIVVSATLGSSFAFWLYDIIANKGVSVVTGSNHPLLYGLAAGVLIFVIRALGSRFLAGTP
ncbi:MAG: preprotein translocase subunit SecE [Polyangiales bacterium]